MGKYQLTKEDRALFRKAVESITPIEDAEINTDTRSKQDVNINPKETKNTRASALYFSSQYCDPVTTNAVLSYRASDFSLKRFNLLKSGKIHWEARLDLHGLSAENAADALREFLIKQESTDNRCFLIIHGKGGHHGEPPVLKSFINHWLRQIPEVLAFHSALPQNGGSGAVYVLLKRRR